MPSTKEKQIGIRVTEREREQYRHAAERDDLTLSAWLRWLAQRRAAEQVSVGAER